MKKIISDKFGCQIIESDNKTFIRYDNGQSASKIVETEISKDEAFFAILSEKNTLNVILSAKKREQ